MKSLVNPMNDDAGTTIWLPFEVKTALDEKKVKPREPYYQVIKRLLKSEV